MVSGIYVGVEVCDFGAGLFDDPGAPFLDGVVEGLFVGLGNSRAQRWMR